MTDIIDETFNRLRDRYESIDDKLTSGPPAVKTFLLVYSAQGVIDNGGYRYFFGSNWPGNPEYSEFIEAYKAIGCDKQAKELARVASTFPFDNPHLHETKRKEYMKANYDEDRCKICGWGEILCGDEEVWERLALFCQKHIQELS